MFKEACAYSTYNFIREGEKNYRKWGVEMNGFRGVLIWTDATPIALL